MTHAVSNTDLGGALRTHVKVYRSLCGHRVFPCPATTPIGPFCPLCGALSRA